MPEINETPESKSRLARIKEFAVAHKTVLLSATTAVVTATVVTKLHQGPLQGAYSFIESEGLDEKFNLFLDGTTAPEQI